VAASLGTFALLTMPIGLRPTSLMVDVGEVAPRNLQAPRDVEYVSEVRTEEARAAAERSVTPVYIPSDPSIARQQIERLRAALQYITLVREDVNATLEQKQDDLAALSDVRLGETAIQQILELPPTRWDAIQQETLSVLEQVMRNSIREDGLEAAQRAVISRVSLSFPEDQADLISTLARAFVVPNSLFSQELTEAARLSARESVEPVVQKYKAGETIVPGGEIVTPADMEALRELGMITPGRSAQDLLGAGAVTLVSAAFVSLYFFRKKRNAVVQNWYGLVVIVLVFLGFLGGARLVIPERTLMPFFYPLPAAGLLLGTLFGLETGVAISLALSLLAVYGLPNGPELAPYYLMSSLTGLLLLGPARRFWAFLRAGLGIAGAGLFTLLAYYIPVHHVDAIGALQLLGAVAFNGLASASIALTLQYLLAQSLGLTTALQLLDLSRPDFPLLQFFLRNAPGT
jgi:membrane-associated HD superfamily phosphohydrolase